MKRKKIFYVPGMISLVLLPLLCLFYFYKNDSFAVYGALGIGLMDEKLVQEYKSKYGFPVPRKYKEFNFNNSEALEKDKLKEMQLSLRELRKKHDTINGLKIHFGRKTTFAVFVNVIDILSIEGMPIWQPYKNDIWVLIGSKPKKSKNLNRRMFCGTQEVMRKNALRLQEIEKEKEKCEFLMSYYNRMWPVLLAYLGILILNILALLKFNKNRKNNQKYYI